MCCKYLFIFQSNLHTFGSIEFIVSGLEPLKAINKVKNQDRHGQIRSQSVPRNEPQLAIELTPVNQKKIRTSREAQRREPRSVRQEFKKTNRRSTIDFLNLFQEETFLAKLAAMFRKISESQLLVLN